jgi:signal transduction histidine kinase/DNA-binding NarL/FixJ family response regulator
MIDEIAKYQRRFERERNARKEAEKLLEDKSLQLYKANQELKTLAENLEKRIKERTLELEQARDQALAANKAKSQLLANMSHEIRTPLNSIIGFSQIILKRSADYSIPNEFIQFFENIKISGEHLTELINNVLDLAKIESGKMQLFEESLELKTLFQGIFHMNRAQALKKKIDFSYHFDPQLPQLIQSDRTKLNQILMNMVSNAIKFTPENKRVEMRATHKPHLICFEIKDEGIGIPEHRKQEIFEAFEQVDNSTTRDFGGTDLGLAITQKMVEMLGGVIWLESQVGQGTTFYVEVPVNFTSSPTVSKKTVQFENVIFSRDLKILVVEDNSINQEIIRAVFEDFNLKIDIADNGKIGVRKALEIQPDLILMDIHMPEMNGIDAIKAIRETSQGAKIPIIVLSAEAFEHKKHEAQDLLIQGYLTKPFQLDQLTQVLLEHLPYEQENELRSEVIPQENSQSDEMLVKQILDKLNVLSITPFSHSDVLIDQIDEILRVSNISNSKIGVALEALQSAVYNGDVQTFNQILGQLQK